jgi:AcrR family transcriptional regulator
MDATRRRVVEAARRILLEGGYRDLSLAGVAKRAGVARATVYYQFQSKLGLLEALAADTERRAGIEAFDRIAGSTSAAETVRLVCQAHARFWAAGEDIFRTIIGLSRIDPDMAELVRRHDAGRREDIRQQVERLSREGALGDGWTVSLATELLWLATSFEAFDHLHARSGLSVEVTGEVLSRVAVVVLEGHRA